MQWLHFNCSEEGAVAVGMGTFKQKIKFGQGRQCGASVICAACAACASCDNDIPLLRTNPSGDLLHLTHERLTLPDPVEEKKSMSFAGINALKKRSESDACKVHGLTGCGS